MVTPTNVLENNTTNLDLKSELYNKIQSKVVYTTIKKIDDLLCSLQISGGNQMITDLVIAYNNQYLTVSTTVSMFDRLESKDSDDWLREFEITFTVIDFNKIVIGTTDTECVKIIEYVNNELVDNSSNRKK